MAERNTVTVTLHVCDLLRQPGGTWDENSSWVRRFPGTAPTRTGAVRKALAKSGYRFRRDYWCESPCWRVPGTAIGAYLED